MQIYLPIAEMSVNVFLIFGMGGGVGFLSGLFGVGGGFLMTPLLIFIGIPPAVAVATEANQIVASSVSGVLAHWRRANVDVKMGLTLLEGGIVGSAFGVWLFPPDRPGPSFPESRSDVSDADGFLSHFERLLPNESLAKWRRYTRIRLRVRSAATAVFQEGPGN